MYGKHHFISIQLQPSAIRMSSVVGTVWWAAAFILPIV